MDLFMNALNKEVKVLHENGVRMRFIGDKSGIRDLNCGIVWKPRSR